MTGAGVSPDQRATPAHPCPICGGHERMKRGEGTRCTGFVSGDGEWAHCSRENHAGNAPYNDRSEAYVHKLRGECRCGVQHGPSVVTEIGPGTGAKRRAGKGPRRIANTHDYTDEGGELLYQTVRYEPKGFSQRRPDGPGKWIWSIKGARLVPFGLPELLAAPLVETVLECEGELDVLRAREMGFTATCNPMGAGKWRAEYSEHLRGRFVVVIRDNDEPGRKHGEDVARSVYGKASSVKVLDLPGVGPGGDLREWADTGGTAEELRRLIDEASEWRPPEEREDGRVDLGQLIRTGVEPPVELVPDVILEGRSHLLYSGPGLGKTYIMLWIILRVLERGAPVILFDKENMAPIMAERLEGMGADTAMLSRSLHYFPDPSLPMDEEALRAYEALLERVKPALVCFDSWIGFLASAGLDENASNDIATFAAHCIHPARSRNIATLILDHVPKDGSGARGSGRKKDEVDVQWNLRPVQSFDRDRTGSVALRREKDRQGWLPRDVLFSIGGDGAGGFLLKRSSGTVEIEDEEGLKDSERQALAALESFGEEGSTTTEWKKKAMELDVSHSSFFRAKAELLQKDRILQENKRFFIRGSIRFQKGFMEPMEPGQTEVPLGSTPLKGGTNGTNGDNYREHSVDCECEGCMYGDLGADTGGV